MNIGKLAKKNGTLEQVYKDLVNKKVRRKYSLPDEFAVMRQRDTKPDEFAAYNTYVENCKAEAKAELGIT